MGKQDQKHPGDAAEQLLRLAHRRTKDIDHGPSLLSYVLNHRSKLRLDALILPEDWTLGYYTPYYADLREEEKIALNHWIYCVYYTRFSRGEVYVCRANAILGNAIAPYQPAIARLLQLESQEEQDHIQSFACIIDTILDQHGLNKLAARQKRFATTLSHRRCISSLWKLFGIDYVVTYFLARGITNHQGVGYERPIARQAGNPAIAKISKLHAGHESQHMAVSNLMSQAARELLPKPKKPRSSAYRRAYSTFQQLIASYAFGEKHGNALEIACAERNLHRMPALRNRPRAFLKALIQEHYAGTTGLQRSQNRTMARDNARILRLAAIPEHDQALWDATLRRVQGHAHYVQPT